MSLERPTFTKGFARLMYNKAYTINVKVPKGAKNVRAVVMDLGYSTHGVHFSQRLVELESTWNGSNKLKVYGPKSTGIFPPGPGWIYVLADDIPSTGVKVMVGAGLSPPVSHSAITNMLKNTKGSV